jgi:hypothetical protein
MSNKLYAYYDSQVKGIKIGQSSNDTVLDRIKSTYQTKNLEKLLSNKDVIILDFTNGINGKDIGDKTDSMFRDFLSSTYNLKILTGSPDPVVFPKLQGQTEYTLKPQNVSVDNFIKFFEDILEDAYFRFTGNLSTFNPRNEQSKASGRIVNWRNSWTGTGDFLIAAKPRFGKTFTSYLAASQLGVNHILVVSYVVVAKNEWKNGLNHIFFKDYEYIDTAEDGYKDINPNKKQVLFLSVQGSNERDDDPEFDNERLNRVLENYENIDIIFFDESHVGSSARLYQKFRAKIQGRKEIPTVRLSGTAFKDLESNIYNDENSFSWDYNDEQLAKKNYSEKTFPENPYLCLPEITHMVFNTDINFEEIFNIETDEEGKPYFIHANDEIPKLLKILKGGYGPFYNGKSKDLLVKIDRRKNNTIDHLLWLLPNLESIDLFAEILKNDDDFKDYKIIALGKNSLSSVKVYEQELKPAISLGKTITLSYDKLTTAVTVKEWSAVIVTRQVNSPEKYFQAILRSQSPWYDANIIHKDICYVYEFNEKMFSEKLVKIAKLPVNNENEDARIKRKLKSYFSNSNINIIDSETLNFEPIDAEKLYDIFNNSHGYKLSGFRKTGLKHFHFNGLAKEISGNPELIERLKKIFSYRTTKDTIDKKESGINSGMGKPPGTKGTALLPFSGPAYIYFNTKGIYKLNSGSDYDKIENISLTGNNNSFNNFTLNFTDTEITIDVRNHLNKDDKFAFDLEVVLNNSKTNSKEKFNKIVKILNKKEIKEEWENIDITQEEVAMAVKLIFSAVPTYLKLSNIREGALEDILLNNNIEYQLFEDITNLPLDMFRIITNNLTEKASQDLNELIKQFLLEEENGLDIYGSETSVFDINNIGAKVLTWKKSEDFKQIKSAQRATDNQEVMTKASTVKEMFDMANINKETISIDEIFLEPGCGGNIPFAGYYFETLLEKIDKYDDETMLLALTNIYGIEYLQDNTYDAKKKIFLLFLSKYINYNKKLLVSKAYFETVLDIINKNIINGDFVSMVIPDTSEPLLFYNWDFEDGILQYESINYKDYNKYQEDEKVHILEKNYDYFDLEKERFDLVHPSYFIQNLEKYLKTGTTLN